MKFYAVVIIFSTLFTLSNSNIGAALSTQKTEDSKCWSPNEVARLRVRKIFERLAPSEVNPHDIDRKYIDNTIKYIKAALRVSKDYIDAKSGDVFKEVLTDTFGAHLKCKILPSVRIAYYAGYIPYRDARRIHDVLDEFKKYLNTQGLGWGDPTEPDWSNLTVAKIVVANGGLFDPCEDLIAIRDYDSCIRFPSPKLDDEDQPTAIAFPFKRGGLVSLTSPNSAEIILKFYESAANCILNSSPVDCRETDLANFHKELWYWMKSNISPHLTDQKLYAAYGGVLRVAATVQTSGIPGLMKQNIFQKPIQKIKNTLKSLQDNDSNWMLYSAIVVIAAIAFCLLQFSYNYMFGDANACECFKKKKPVPYVDIKSIFPHIHKSNSSKNSKCTFVPSRCKNLSQAAIPTQKVYDMNANAEQMMAIIMSDHNDTSEDESDEISEVESPLEPSPPKIETRTSHLQIRTPCSVKSKSLFSTSSFSRSDIHYTERKDGSNYTESGNSDISMASDSVNNRDLGSIPKMSKQSGLKKSLSTDVDVNSYLTPLSRGNFK